MDHVLHEIKMLERSLALLEEVNPKDDTGLRQALATSFAVRARALHEFFWREDRNNPDDMLAKDFVANWSVRGLDKSTVTRIHKELAHLSYKRNEMPEEGYRFEARSVYEALLPVIKAFLTARGLVEETEMMVPAVFNRLGRDLATSNTADPPNVDLKRRPG